MAQIPVEASSPNGLKPTMTAASTADKFKNDSSQRTQYIVKNGGGAARLVTFVAQDTSVKHPTGGDLSVADYSRSIPVGEEWQFGPFPEAYNDINGDVNVTLDDATSVTVGAVKLQKQGV